MKLKFIALDYDYLNIRDTTYIRIFGKTDDGKSCCIIDESINYFYTLSNKPEKLEKKIKKIKRVKKTEILEKKFMGKKVKVIKTYMDYKDRKKVSREIKDLSEDVKIKERDIRIVTKYIINKKIEPFTWCDVEGKALSDKDLNGLPSKVNTDFVLKLEKAKKSEKQEKFEPDTLAFDIETENIGIGSGKILMISLVSKNFKKVLTWKNKSKKQDYVEKCKNEKEMIQKFKKYVNKIDPDMLTGYFSDGFDLPYLRKRARKHKIKLKLGRGKSKIRFSRGRPKKARIKGMPHIDLLKFIRTIYSQYMQSETLSLDDVSLELLGEGKKEFDQLDKKTSKMKKDDWSRFFEYNLQDSVLTYKLFKKAWQDMFQFVKIIKEPIYKTVHSSMSYLVESYIIHNLDRFDEIAERKPSYDTINKRKSRKKYLGGYVLEPQADLYENLAIFDFSSMYPSVIVSFNLSLPTMLNKKKKGCHEIKLEDKTVYFSKKRGFIPELLGEIIKLRKKYKKELKEKPDPIKKARSNAFKLLANATYGYHGFFGARYYSPEVAAATAALARKYIKDVIEKTNKKGYKVIYADTDGYALLLKEHSKKQAKEFLKKLNKDLPGVMELELEDFFKRGLWVTKRSGKFGAKKKYALLDYNNELKIRGFETVRRDWCNLARNTQNEVLEKILKKGNEKEALKFVKEVIKKLKERKIQRENLIIKTQLKKPLSEYKAKVPHVVIARRMKKKGEPIEPGMLITYYIAEVNKKNALVRERARLPEEEGKYDIEYYLKKQILPAVENIFGIFDINTKEIIEGKKQTLLDGF